MKEYISNLTLAAGDYVADTASPLEPPLDPAFIENMRYAEEAMNYTVKALPRGASNWPNSSVSSGEIRAMRVVTDVVATMRVIFRALNFFKPRLECKGAIDISLTTESECARKYGIGNCGEHAIVSFLYLQKDKKNPTCDLVSLTNADHAFTIVGRDSSSSLKDPATWGKSAVICDPWARLIYPASEFTYNMKETLRNYGYIPDDWSEDEQPRAEIVYNDGKSKNPSEEYSIKPILTEEKELALQNKLKNYHSLKNKVRVHKSLEMQSKDASIVAGAIGLLGKMSRKLKGRSSGLLMGSSLMLSATFYASSYFSPKHEKMYEEKIRQFWQNRS